MNTKIQFRRYGPDDVEILPDNFTLAQMFAQMLAEFCEFDPQLKIKMIESERIGDWDFFMCEIEWNDSVSALVEYLQSGYDEYGIAGFFETNPDLWATEKTRAMVRA